MATPPTHGGKEPIGDKDSFVAVMCGLLIGVRFGRSEIMHLVDAEVVAVMVVVFVVVGGESWIIYNGD